MAKRAAARHRFAIGLLMAMWVSVFHSGVARAAAEDEIRALFSRFVAAQNSHDLRAVGEILEDSPRFLWITRGVQHRGREAALRRFAEYYQGTWSLEPKLDEVTIIELSSDVAQLTVPTVFSIAPPGQTPQPALFLLNHIYVRSADGWKLTSILPILVP